MHAGMHTVTGWEIFLKHMDFYAHSNWVELGRNDLIDDGNGKWTLLQPFNLIKGVLIKASDVPNGYSLTHQGTVVTVTSLEIIWDWFRERSHMNPLVRVPAALLWAIGIYSLDRERV
jgi:hypothetical protein